MNDDERKGVGEKLVKRQERGNLEKIKVKTMSDRKKSRAVMI